MGVSSKSRICVELRPRMRGVAVFDVMSVGLKLIAPPYASYASSEKAKRVGADLPKPKRVETPMTGISVGAPFSRSLVVMPACPSGLCASGV